MRVCMCVTFLTVIANIYYIYLRHYILTNTSNIRTALISDILKTLALAVFTKVIFIFRFFSTHHYFYLLLLILHSN